MNAKASTILRTVMAASLGLCLWTGCGSGKTGKKRAANAETNSVVIEWMRHEKEGLVVENSVKLGVARDSFSLAETRFQVLDRWPHSEAKREVLNDNPKEHHAVKLSWEAEKPESAASGDGDEPGEWVFQSEENAGAATPLGEGLEVRLLPPGALPRWDGLWPQDPRRTIQFTRQGKHHSVPKDGEEVFPGWKLREVKLFTHALLEESGALHESSDSGFTNRAVEAILVSDDGATVERHYAFLDHPELTKGIHPALLPVARLSGDGASHSRLTVCDRLDQPGKKDSLFVCSEQSDPKRLRAFTWNHQTKAINEVAIEELPAKITLPDKRIVHLHDHLVHGRPVVKWRRLEAPSNGDPKPATVIGWAEAGIGHKQVVLVHNHPTPVQLGGQLHTFRSRHERG